VTLSWRRAPARDVTSAQPVAIRAGCEPLLLPANTGRAALLLHGFGDTPQTFCYLAPVLNAAGFTVQAPLLPGHGRSVQAFDESTGSEWLDAAREALRSLAATHDAVGVAGLSMGGTLAVILAAELQDVRALALIAPYIAMPRRHVTAAALHRVWAPVLGPRQGREVSIQDPEERARNLGYGWITGRALHQLWVLVRRARRDLPRVTVPTLIVQSREDNRLAPAVAEYVHRTIGAPAKRLVLTNGGGHIATVDRGRDAVISEVRDWFRAHLAASLPATSATKLRR
jgi:carboxylesterase